MQKDDCVSFDLYTGAQNLARYLLGRGYRRFAYLSPFDSEIEMRAADSYLGCAEALNCAAAPLRYIRTLPDTETREAGLHTAAAIAAEPAGSRPEAIICHNDTVAIGLHCGLCRAGVRVPEDVAVAGFDGLEEGRFLVRPLTTVESPVEPLCAAGIELLASMIRSDTTRAGRRIQIATSLRLGGTA